MDCVNHSKLIKTPSPPPPLLPALDGNGDSNSDATNLGNQ